MLKSRRLRRLWDTYRFAGFRPGPTVVGVFGDPKARVIRLHRRGKKHAAVSVAARLEPGTTARFVVSAISPAAIRESIWTWRSDVLLAGVAAR
jgi:hypothetical protein